MPMQTLTTAFNANTGSFVVLNPNIKGHVTVLIRASVDAVLVNDDSATSAVTAAAAETAGKYFFSAAGVYNEIRCDPSTTWVRGFSATGGNAFVSYQW